MVFYEQEATPNISAKGNQNALRKHGLSHDNARKRKGKARGGQRRFFRMRRLLTEGQCLWPCLNIVLT